MAKFKQGQSGNPKGRPKGIVDRRTQYRELINSHVPEVINRVVDAALGGDIRACKLLLDKVLPSLRPEYETSAYEVEGNSALDGANAIIRSMLVGMTSPEKAQAAISAIASYQNVTDLVEVEERLKALERAYGQR
jgi:hypothetical protein